MVFPTFFNLSLNFAISASWSELQSAPGLIFAYRVFHLWLQRLYNQSDFSIDHLVMSMYRVISCVIRKGFLLWAACSLDKTLLAFALLHFVLQGQTCCYSRYLLTSYFCIPVPYDEKDIFFVLVLEGLVGPHRIIQLQFLRISGWGIDLDYCDVQWFALETNPDHSVVFAIASKFNISDSFIDYEARKYLV